MGGFVRNMLFGDKNQPYKQGWASEEGYVQWMQRWIGASCDKLVEVYRRKPPDKADAKKTMQDNLAAMQACKAALKTKQQAVDVGSDRLTSIMNSLMSRDVEVVLRAMSADLWLSNKQWKFAVKKARGIWDGYKAEGQPLNETTWDLAISLRDTYPQQLPSTYRHLMYKVLFVDLDWMNDQKLPDEMEEIVRCLFPNPEGLSYVPWKPPSQRGAGKKGQQAAASAPPAKRRRSQK
jgi:hypothetical protein